MDVLNGGFFTSSTYCYALQSQKSLVNFKTHQRKFAWKLSLAVPRGDHYRVTRRIIQQMSSNDSSALPILRLKSNENALGINLKGRNFYFHNRKRTFVYTKFILWKYEAISLSSAEKRKIKLWSLNISCTRTIRPLSKTNSQEGESRMAGSSSICYVNFPYSGHTEDDNTNLLILAQQHTT